MKFRLLTILSALSLLVCSVTCALWVRTACTYDCFTRASGGHCIVMDTSDGSVWIREYDGWPGDEALQWWHGDRAAVGYYIGWTPGSLHWAYLGPDGRPLQKGYAREMIRERIPLTVRPIYWLAFFNWVILTLLLPFASVSRTAFAWTRRRVQVRRGFCARCNYDLRATPTRCPECGTVPGEIRRSI